MSASANPPASPTTAWEQQLVQGLQRLSLSLGRSQRQRLLDYLALLQTWNRAYNLTAVRDPAQMVTRQLLDSLSILPWLDAGPVLDVGSGAGLPGDGEVQTPHGVIEQPRPRAEQRDPLHGAGRALDNLDLLREVAIA